jgi:hypothetical protein
MKKITIIIISVGLFQISVNGQFLKEINFKTRPYQDFVAYNPTIGIEKPLKRIYSLELEFMYRNRNWNSSEGDLDFGRFYDGDGFRVLAGSRVYFGKTNKHINRETQKSTFGWFGIVQFGYSQSRTYDIEKWSSGFLFLGGYKNTIDVEKNWAELNFGIGRQFYLFKTISLDLYFGPSIYFAHSEQTTITESINLTEIGTIETENYDFGRIIKPNIVLTIGYYFK